MAAERTNTVGQKRRPVNGRKRKQAKKRASRDNVVYLDKPPSKAAHKVGRRRFRKAVLAPQVHCSACKLSHAQGDAHNRITLVVVAGELAIKVEAVRKKVQRIRDGSETGDFPLPVSAPRSPMLFDACAIARFRHQRTAGADRAVSLAAQRVRAELEAAIDQAETENANLDIQLKRIALDAEIKAKKEHRKRLIDLYRQMFVDEAAFRSRMRVLEKELKQFLSDSER